LVDDQQVLVLVCDPERDVLAHDLGLRRRGLELDRLAAFEPVAFRASRAVHLDGACLQQSLRRRAGADLGQRGEEAVEPLASGGGGNGAAYVRQRDLASAARSTRRGRSPSVSRRSSLDMLLGTAYQRPRSKRPRLTP